MSQRGQPINAHCDKFPPTQLDLLRRPPALRRQA
jgi:hypothetical protein